MTIQELRELVNEKVNEACAEWLDSHEITSGDIGFDDAYRWGELVEEFADIISRVGTEWGETDISKLQL